MIEKLFYQIGPNLIDLLDKSGYGLCITEGKFKLLWFNQTFQDWFTQSEGKFIYQAIEETNSEKDSLLFASMKENDFQKIEIKHPSSHRWFSVSAVRFFVPENNDKYFLFVVEETTEKKLVFENYISQLEILDNVEDGIYSTDFENKIIYWNKGAEKIYGYSAKEVIGKVINQDFILYDPVDMETQIQITQELEKYRTYCFKRKEYRNDGAEIWVEGNVTLISDTGDKPVGLIYIVRSITGKLTSEILNYLNANLQKSLRELTASLINDFTFSDIINQLTKKCKDLTESEVVAILKVNENESEMIAVNSDRTYNESTLEELNRIALTILRWLELYKTTLTSFDEKAPEIIESLNNILGTKHFIIAPVIIKNEIRYFILIGADNFFLQKFKTEMLNSFASLFSFIISYFDKKILQETLEEKLKQTQKFELASKLICGIVHDFKNLLSGIKSSVDFIKTKHATSIPSDLIKEIESMIYRGLDLSKSLLEVGKPLKPAKIRFKLNKLLDEIYNLAVKICPVNIKVIKDYDDLPEIYADFSQLHQVFMNLILNAKDAMPQGGVLKIGVENIYISEKEYIENPKIKPGNYAVINISDTGIGIPKENIDKIFEPYYTTKESQKGTGLGLFISQNIVFKHNGFILPESVVGKGTTVKVYLPVTEIEKIETNEAVKKIIKQYPTILLVDDEETIRTLLSEMLTLQNFEVIESGSGLEAVNLFEKYFDKIDLVITDYYLKDMTGADVLKFIRERNPNIPVFIATGTADEKIIDLLKDLKADKIIEKPYEFDSLLGSIANYVKLQS